MTKQVTLGSGESALITSALGFGAMGLTAFYGDLTPEDEAIALLKRAFDLGVRHFDTAQAYVRRDPDGTIHSNEVLVGKFLKTLTDEERAEVTVATKFRYMKPEFNKEEFKQATIASAERLGVDCIDLYYLHRIFPPAVASVETWMTAFKELVEEGLIKRIGLSEASPKVIREAHAIHPITCIQQEWSLFARDLEAEIVPLCKELGIGIVSYSPIGRGFLAGGVTTTPTDWRQNVPYLAEENIAKNLEIKAEMEAMAKEKGCTLGQLCLAWVMAKGAVPIPGTSKIHHLEDNMGALDVNLTEEEIQQLGDLGDKVTGARGDEGYMKATYHAHI